MGSQPENPGQGSGKFMGQFSREHWLMFLPLLVSASYSDGCVCGCTLGPERAPTCHPSMHLQSSSCCCCRRRRRWSNMCSVVAPARRGDASTSKRQSKHYSVATLTTPAFQRGIMKSEHPGGHAPQNRREMVTASCITQRTIARPSGGFEAGEVGHQAQERLSSFCLNMTKLFSFLSRAPWLLCVIMCDCSS